MDWPVHSCQSPSNNNNYFVQGTGTRYTQTLYRIRLRLYAPNQRVPDVVVKVVDQLPDPGVKTTHDDWYAQAWETEFGAVLFGNASEKETEEATITEVPIDDVTTAHNEAVITTSDKTSSGDISSFNLDVSDNPYFMTPPPMESPQYRPHYRL